MTKVRVIPMVLGAFLLATVVLKLLHPDSLDGLLRWAGVPGFLRTPVGASLVGAEATLAAMLILRSRDRATTVFAVAFLGIGSMALAAIALSRNPPNCGCMGMVRIFESERAEAVAGIGRNLVFLGLLAWRPRTMSDRAPRLRRA